MTADRQKSSVWAMINWALIEVEIKEKLAILPDQNSIQLAIEQIESQFSEEDLFLKEAEEIEHLLVSELIKILRKNRSKEIKKARLLQEKVPKKIPREKVDVKVIPIGNPDQLKDMGLDPEIMDEISKNVMDQFFFKKKRKDDDEDEDEDPSASFYM